MEALWVWLTGGLGWVVEIIHAWGYPGIFALMALESSCFPFPSEVVMVPAGYLAQQGKMSLGIAFLCGVGGSLAGAIINYYLAIWLGRPILLRYGKYFFIPEKKLLKAEAFFRQHGEIGTFTCRLIPGIRQLISLPAGLAKMNFLRFNIFTGLGAGIWMAVLLWIGYACGQQAELIKEYSHRAALAALAGVALIMVGYVLWKVRARKNPKKKR
jgi:membrane protein DedA with SNARE-associated domain